MMGTNELRTLLLSAPEALQGGKGGSDRQEATCVNCTGGFLFLPNEAKSDILCSAGKKKSPNWLG